ncbi:MAG: hypothetical protein ACI9XC_002642, partial [Gammaproteobacteria bacterium]
TSTSAMEWTVDPIIELDTSITDNIRLEGSKEGDLVTIVSPGVLIKRQSHRLDLTVNYQLEGIIYKNNSKNNRFINLLDGSVKGEIFKDRIFLDLIASSGEQNVNNSGAIGVDNTSISDTRAKIVTYKVSPYWHEKVGNLLNTDIRYERDSIESSENLDSSSNKFFINIFNGTTFTRLLWRINFKDEKINYPFGVPTKFRNFSAESEYLITQKFSLKARTGYDDNSYANRNEDINGFLWRLGSAFRPSRRVSLEVGMGKRYFGTDIFVEMAYRNKRIQSMLSFYREPDTTRSTLLEQQLFPLTDIFGDPIINQQTGEQRRLNVSVPIQSTEVLIRERLEGALIYTLKKHTFNVSVFNENNKYELSRGNEEIFGLALDWLYNINRITEVRLGLDFNKNYTLNGRDQQFRVIEYKLTRLIGSGLNATLSYRHVNVKSNIAAQSYDQNVFAIGVSKYF